MPPSYDLIYQSQGKLKIETVEVSDAAEARRLGREKYPDCICGVVCHEKASASTAEDG